MSPEKNNPDHTPIMGLPRLTVEQKQALHERPDHGITPVEGIKRFPTYQDWLNYGGLVGTDNFHMLFVPGVSGFRRKTQHVQRFTELYPEQTVRLMRIEVRRDDSDFKTPISEAEEKDYYDAYEKMADLVDANDDPRIIANGQELPFGQVVFNVLFS